MQFRKTDTARQRKKVREEMRKQSVKNNIALLFMEPAVSREFGSTTGNSNYCQLLVLSSPLQRSSAIKKCDISENVEEYICMNGSIAAAGSHLTR